MQEPRARKSDIMTFHSLGCCAPCGSCLLRKLHVFMYRCHFDEDSPPERSARFFGIVGISGFLRKSERLIEEWPAKSRLWLYGLVYCLYLIG